MRPVLVRPALARRLPGVLLARPAGRCEVGGHVGELTHGAGRVHSRRPVIEFAAVKLADRVGVAQRRRGALAVGIRRTHRATGGRLASAAAVSLTGGPGSRRPAPASRPAARAGRLGPVAVTRSAGAATRRAAGAAPSNPVHARIIRHAGGKGKPVRPGQRNGSAASGATAPHAWVRRGTRSTAFGINRCDNGTMSRTAVVNLKGRRRDPGYADVVYVGRAMHRGGWQLPASLLANPFRPGRDGSRAEVMTRYREYLLGRPDLLALLPGLRGRRLGCWCAPEACHAEVIAELADMAP
jgi:Domain of unknown function (DUF4326)